MRRHQADRTATRRRSSSLLVATAGGAPRRLRARRHPGLDLLRAGCPEDVRIATDALPARRMGALLLGCSTTGHAEVQADGISAPLVVDGSPHRRRPSPCSGVTASTA